MKQFEWNSQIHSIDFSLCGDLDTISQWKSQP